MKKSLLASVVAFVALLLASCSNDASKLLKCIPADADFVAVLNVQAGIESAGGSVSDSQIKLPKEITNLLGSREQEDFDDLNDKLKKSGVEINTIAIAGNFKDNSPVVVFALDNKDKFVKFIEDEDFEETDEEDGVKYYSKCTYKSDYDPDWSSYSFFGVKDNVAYYLSYGKKKDAKIISKFIEQADEKSFDDTKFGDYISEGNAAGAYVKIPKELKSELRNAGVSSEMLDLCSGAICFKGDLMDDKAVVEMKMFDEDGNAKDTKAFEKYMDLNAKVSGTALEYMQPGQQFVAASSLKNVKWDKWLDVVGAGLSRSDRAQLSAVLDYLKHIDGTVAFGVGVKNGLESFVAIERNEDNAFDQLSMTIVVETKDGKAKSLVNDLKSLLDSESVPYESTSNGFSVDLPKDAKAYCKYEDNLIVLSNNPIKKASNNAVKNFDFTNFIGACVLSLGKDDKIMKDLGLDNYDVTCSISSDSKNMTATATVEIKGGKKSGIIAKALEMALEVYDNRGKIEDKCEEYSSKYKSRWEEYDYGYGYDDYYYGDTTAVAVEAWEEAPTEAAYAE